ncbi:uncharacterized protein TNCV_2913671 [Trichonephila clavipes]|nr:uncharacterized protein TNCV_2913671 [Trichonephila clavipes]
MSRFGGLSEERPSVFKTPSKLGTHLSTQCSGDERQSRPCPDRTSLPRSLSTYQQPIRLLALPQGLLLPQETLTPIIWYGGSLPTRGPLATDHVILNHGQVTWTTPELAPPLLTTTPHQREDVSALDRFNVHRCPTRRVFSGTGLESVTKQATVRYLYHSATAATSISVS